LCGAARAAKVFADVGVGEGHMTAASTWCIPLRVADVPFPGGTNDGSQVGFGCGPAKNLLRFAWIRDKFRWISVARWFDTDFDRLTGYLASAVYDFQNRMTMAARQVQELGEVSPPEISKGASVRFGKVANVYVIADRGAVRCGVTIAKHRNLF